MTHEQEELYRLELREGDWEPAKFPHYLVMIGKLLKLWRPLITLDTCSQSVGFADNTNLSYQRWSKKVNMQTLFIIYYENHIKNVVQHYITLGWRWCTELFPLFRAKCSFYDKSIWPLYWSHLASCVWYLSDLLQDFIDSYKRKWKSSAILSWTYCSKNQLPLLMISTLTTRSRKKFDIQSGPG